MGLLFALGLGAGLPLASAQTVRYASDASGNVVQQSAVATAAPQIVGQPQMQVVVPGDHASFCVTLADSSGCAYRWLFYGTNLAGQSGDSLVVLNATTNQQGPYSVVVTNSFGSVTSSVAQLYIDTRGCGMPDSWQLTYFGNLNQNALGDYDGDGVPNLQEFLDGTNPTNSTSFRSRLTVLADGGSVTVTPEQASYALTDNVTLTATPLANNAFFSWTGDLSARTNPATFTMNTNKTVRAHFACTAPPPGMVGWWRGENNALDALGANSGFLSNGVSFAAGQVGQAFVFNGTNQEVKIPASTSLNVGVGGGLTLETWAKPADLVNQYPLMEWSEGTTWGVHLWVNVAFSGQGGQGCLYANVRDVNLADHYFFSPAGLLSTSAWSHVALTYDRASGAAKLFFNGLAVAAVNLGSFVPFTSTNLHLGYRPGSVSYQGSLDEPTVYNRALSPAEVYGLYFADAAGKCSNIPYITSPAQWPGAVVGVGYTQQVISVFGAPAVTYSLSAGTVPAGLTLSASGLLSGVPTAAGSNVFALRATDALGLNSELICGLNVAPAPVVASPPGLLAWWRAENNALDSLGGHNGNLSNGVVYATGKVGQAFSFDGTNSYVVAPDAGFPVGSAPRTVEFWMQYAPGGLGNHEPFIYGTAGASSSFYVVILGNRLYIGQYGGGDTPGSTIATDGNWHHIALTYDGFTAWMYVDGNLDASVARTYATTLSGSFYMGAVLGTSDRFKGQVDELAVYNRALSPSEVMALYQAGSLGKKNQGPYFNTPSPLPDALLAQAYSQTLSTLFGALPVSYSVGSGVLPPGLSLSSQGLLSGTPTNAGGYNFVVHALDSASQSNDAPYSLQVYAPLTPPPGLVSWWRAEANGLDSAGTNNGTLRNGAGFATGRVGQAFALDGASQSVDVTDAPSLHPASVTLETWALFTGGGTRVVMGKPLGAGTLDSYQIYLSGGALGAYISDAASGGAPVSTPFSPALGNWYHLAYTFDDASKQQALYLNGTQVATGVVNKSIGYDNQPVLLGRDIDNGSPVYFFGGRLDESALYNRALGSNEIAALFNAGPAGKSAAGPAFATPPLLPVAVVSQGYTQALALARGTAQSFALRSGTLPPGLGLSSAGVLSGIPTTTGNYSFVVRATDSLSLTGDQPFTLQVAPRVVPPAGLVSWWRAEGNPLDAIGGNNGTLINNATFAPGKVGQAFSLNGSSDAVEIEDAPSLRPASVTLEAWVMFFSAGGVQSIMAKTVGGGTADSYQLWLNNGNLSGVVCDINGANNIISVPFTPNLGQWYHVAFTFDDTTKQQILYLNGAAVAFGISNLTIGYDTHPLLLGADDDNNAQVPMTSLLQGRIDEASLYNRALSPTEVAALYSADAAGKATAGPYITTPPSLPDAAYGRAYTQTVASVGGTPAVTYALTSGALPTGLTLTAQGVLSGVPTNLLGVVPANATLYTFTVRVTDAAGLFADQNFSLRVAAPVPPVAGLVSWWRAENNALDSIGTNNGVALNGATYAPGMAGQAFALDGINDCILIADSPSLRPASLTIECWVMFSANTGIRIIIAKPVGGGTLDSFALWLENGVLKAVISDTGASAPVLASTFTPVVGQWYHLAFTYDGFTRQQVLYLNNVTVATGVADRPIAYDSSPMLLGCDMDNGTRDWFVSGRIDEAAIYNRALTANEIAALYYAGAAGKGTVGPYFTTAPALPDAIVNQGYSQSIVATRGTAPVVYTLSSGSLPPGLSFSSGGLLSGTPASPGTFTFTAHATDAAALVAEQAYTVTVYAPVFAPAGLVGWWRGESNAVDQLGTHNGTLQGNATYASGRVGTAFKLDGVNSYVSLGAWNAGSNWTLEAWVKASSWPGGRTTIFGDLANCLDWGIELTGGQLGAQVRQPGGCSLFLGSGVYASPGFWYHVAATCDGTNATFYVNGAPYGTAAVQPNYVGDGSGPRIGSSVCCGEYFPGLVDEVSLYNRALSAPEVVSLYNAGPAGKYRVPPIVLQATPQPNAVALSFLAATGITYTVQSETSFAGPWSALSNFIALNTNVTVSFPTTNGPQRFYRVSTTGN